VRTSWAVVGTALALTWAGPAAAEPAFTVAVAHTGSEPDGVAIADVTGDGRDDLLVQTGYDPGDKNNWKLFVFPSLEDGTLGAATSYPTDEYNNFNQAGLGTGDLDGDGDDDVAVPTHAGVDLYYQQNGSLEGPQLIPETQGVQEATILDIDGMAQPSSSLTPFQGRPTRWAPGMRASMSFAMSKGRGRVRP
jgi:hypothetical protein